MNHKLDIVIHAAGMPFNGETVRDKSLGGSESAAYYQARELARRGHRVLLWTSSEQEGAWDGVTYMFHGPVTQAAPLGEKFTFYAGQTPHDVLIIQRHPLAFHRDYASKINVWQLHDVALYRQAGVTHGGLPRVDVVTCVSEWHAGQVQEVYGIGPEVVRAVPNGVDPALYAEPFERHPTAVGLKAEGKFLCLYQSRPERGLEHLLRPGGIMARLAEAKSDAHLVFCTYEGQAPQMAGYYAQLDGWAAQLPNVTHLPPMPKAELARLQRSCDLLLYPTEFSEVSCITAMEAMHAGLPMLTSNYAALAETCEDTGAVLVDLLGAVPPVQLDNLIAGRTQQEVDEQAFADQVKGLEHNPQRLDQLRAKQLKAAPRYTWERAVDRLEQVIGEAFARRRKPANTLRHLIEHSDIVAADYYVRGDYASVEAGLLPDKGGAILAAGKRELSLMYEFAYPRTADPDALRLHYEYWEGLNCDRLAQIGDAADEIERFTQTTRFRGILQYVARAISAARAMADSKFLLAHQAWRADCAAWAAANEQEGNLAVETDVDVPGPEPVRRGVRVMEFGCAHGHVLLPIAKLFPDVEFVGVDFMARSVKMAFESAQQFKIGNVSFTQRDQSQLGADLGEFDCVIAAEVLEHVWDYEATLYALRERLRPGGALVTTTPCGRWEWSGRDNWRKGRQHLHHFESADLQDVFGPWGLDRETDMLYAPAEGSDGTGAQMGSWICYVQPKDAGLGRIDYERKFELLAPRETVSLCMIVKDGEATLRRALLPVLPWVDQVVVAVDKATSDETFHVLLRLEQEHPQVPFKVFSVNSPLEIGFAAARNRTLDEAEGDWILWMDADEELPNASNIWRLLRPSAFNAYACPQIHYSVQPAQVLTTDFPCRLFRHKRGARFYGWVHEHPEDEPGKAINHTMMMGDVQFLHAGYVDEAVRRRRYQRNLPLLMRDLEDNPDRYLNKFLLLRDLAQGLGFEAGMRGSTTPEMLARAQKGVDTFKELLGLKKPVLRMLIDSMPYYSLCVELLGVPGSFDATLGLKVERVGTPSMQADVTLRGRFADRVTYFKFLNLIAEESTKSYESKYA